MTNLQKRYFTMTALSAVAAAALVGCGKKEEAKPVVVAPTPAPAASAPAPTKLLFEPVFVTPAVAPIAMLLL